MAAMICVLHVECDRVFRRCCTGKRRRAEQNRFHAFHCTRIILSPCLALCAADDNLKTRKYFNIFWYANYVIYRILYYSETYIYLYMILCYSHYVKCKSLLAAETGSNRNMFSRYNLEYILGIAFEILF